MDSPKQLTIRDVSPELARRLKARANTLGMSVNRTVLSLLEDALGIDERRRHLKESYGGWTEHDYEEFQEALQAQRTVDARLWQ